MYIMAKSELEDENRLFAIQEHMNPTATNVVPVAKDNLPSLHEIQ